MIDRIAVESKKQRKGYTEEQYQAAKDKYYRGEELSDDDFEAIYAHTAEQEKKVRAETDKEDPNLHWWSSHNYLAGKDQNGVARNFKLFCPNCPLKRFANKAEYVEHLKNAHSGQTVWSELTMEQKLRTVRF